MSKTCKAALLGLGLAVFLATTTSAHGVATQDQGFLANASGVHIGPFVYLGAKHMVTGYDHLFYLAGVIFFLRRLRDVVTFVSLFAVGHSITLLFGVLSGLYVNTYLIDAIIGLSVCYKALENLEVFRLINPKSAVFGFGLVHGLGLSSKLQDLTLSPDGLIINMLAFNVGVEIGQVIALIVLFGGLAWLRQRPDFTHIATGANVALLAAGLVLFGMQSVGYFAT
ncbi:HupE/UreJ protein [Yoonia maricola]|uniref:HupE/UreJ protein n=1 Tax=Yoonia maricola TaxID=420999 RepID=A0A2M8W4U4_9RHOB|nr:HupE/UreJ family protein [Yoonia maricola]PJI85944.1 HupE/UreJ protein [Yoonia maricola]